MVGGSQPFLQMTVEVPSQGDLHEVTAGASCNVCSEAVEISRCLHDDLAISVRSPQSHCHVLSQTFQKESHDACLQCKHIRRSS